VFISVLVSLWRKKNMPQRLKGTKFHKELQ
jgi:hypothetical protein